MRLRSRVGSSPLTRGKLGCPAHAGRTPGLIPAHAGKTTTSTPSRPTSRAHPRSRGENGGTQEGAHLGQGSSPLTRGKRAVAHELNHTNGLIPAHAGKTGGSSIPPGLDWAHPRSRGENSGSAYAEAEPVGSSPLTRGKLRHNQGRR